MSLFRSELNRYTIMHVLFPASFIIHCRELRPCPHESENILNTISFIRTYTISTKIDLNLFYMNEVSVLERCSFLGVTKVTSILRLQ